MATGKVKWFNDERGYGFIQPDDGSCALFVHYSDIQIEGFKTLQDNQRVTFEAKNGPKGRQAISIQPH
ncbi:cold-shock protein [Paraburkholderia unamae]|uniref:Cold-shock protein n=1 Tax=Paraburkholderia unamae TaxID=219649 RepID=A0ACC6RP50_9BURK